MIDETTNCQDSLVARPRPQLSPLVLQMQDMNSDCSNKAAAATSDSDNDDLHRQLAELLDSSSGGCDESSITPAKLRRLTLEFLGETIGPVTPKTKKIYLNKLRSALKARRPLAGSTAAADDNDDDDSQSVQKTLIFEDNPKKDEAVDVNSSACANNSDKFSTATFDLEDYKNLSHTKLYVVSAASSKESCIESLEGDDIQNLTDNMIFYTLKDANSYLKQKSKQRLFILENSDLKLCKSKIDRQNDIASNPANNEKIEEIQSSQQGKAESTFCQEFKNGLNMRNQLTLSSETLNTPLPSANQSLTMGKQLSKFKYAIQSLDVFTVKSMVMNNPRLLINTDSDIPSILHEGFRLNALHLAARSNSVRICAALLDFVSNKNFLLSLYHNFTSKSKLGQVRDRLLDFFLNMGEAGMHDTPLHIACKNASIEIVKLFVSYPQIQINKHNKLGLTPSQTIGTNLESISKLLDLEVRNALEGQVVITLLQKGECEQPKLLISPLKADLTEEASESDNNSNICQNDYSVNKSGESKKSNQNFANGKMKSPYKRAQLGPLSPSMAKEIKQIWAMSRSTKSNPTLNHLLEDKSSDISKGFESVGRYLAKQNKFKWLEYWSMLDMDIDIGSEDGLNQLDNYFVNKISKYVIQDFLDSVHLLSQKAELDDITINKQPGIQMNLITNNSDNLTFNSPANRDNFVPIEKERLNIEFPTLGDREFQTFSPLDDNTKTAQQNQQQMSPLMSGMNILYEELLSKYTPNSNFQQQKQHKQELDLCFDVPCSKFDSVYSQSESDLSLYADKTLVSVLNRNIMKHRSVLNDIIKQIVSKITNMANFVVNDILFDIKITHVGYSTHPRQKLVNITKNRVINCNNNFDNNCTISGKLTASLITNKNISSSVIIISEPYKYEIIGAHLNLEEDLSSGLSPSPSQFGFHSYETDVCSIIFNLPTLQHKDFFIENFEFSKQDQDVMKALVYSDISTINSLPFVYDWYRRISMKN